MTTPAGFGAVGESSAATPASTASSAQDLPVADPNGGPAAQSPERQMVYTAAFEVATSSVQDAMNRFIHSCQSAGGYLDSRQDSRVVCRVPAARFQEIVSELKREPIP